MGGGRIPWPPSGPGCDLANNKLKNNQLVRLRFTWKVASSVCVIEFLLLLELDPPPDDSLKISLKLLFLVRDLEEVRRLTCRRSQRWAEIHKIYLAKFVLRVFKEQNHKKLIMIFNYFKVSINQQFFGKIKVMTKKFPHSRATLPPPPPR